ncbi:GNAT family N-acetyltransferase [Streptomonospora wellingtoniae]|uniref:GNAT family N-acetyltransferase n=1 Tax=Streptomonospora wellingtoniae TaxID=3075544 RepID=A0ABU2KTD7_9ACTN|nr:GNAT family N-acetyltransferase [Streptomonospora sp. DSM 45055]MDT0302471.1 GNAT family N-acetyltransferase [Streptomonospora sp. DSM 45055]
MPRPSAPPSAEWPTAVPLATERLRLEPLRVEHAREAFAVFKDVRLHTWTGGEPASLDELTARYRRQAVGRSPDGTQGWLNWMLRRDADGLLVGTVQATLGRPRLHRPLRAHGLEAELAWMVGTAHQGRGYARESALAMARWLRTRGVLRLTAHIHPGHTASEGVARSLGLSATAAVADGETVWAAAGP